LSMTESKVILYIGLDIKLTKMEDGSHPAPFYEYETAVGS